ncbi:MAG TPA: NusG domain II-containing protein, partial [Candidatus Tenderia electrophaga]|nr:NusG domain II-containing protein [Candidatus Tenderia electrophaga]
MTRLTLADKIVVTLALLLLPFLYIEFWGNSTQGEVVQIRSVNGDNITLPLDQDKRLQIKGALGLSIIEIKDRQVRFIDSPCQGKQCIIAGWLNKDGQLAACLPNGVTVQIIGRDQ